MTRSVEVIVTSRYPADYPGGLERVATAQAEGLAALRSDWTVSRIHAFRAKKGIAALPVVGDLVASVSLSVKLIVRGDVFVVNGAEYAGAISCVARIRRKAVLVVWHGVRSAETRSRFPGASCRWRLARLVTFLSGVLQGFALRSARTIAVGPNVASEIRSTYGYDGPIDVIPNGIWSFESIDPVAREERGTVTPSPLEDEVDSSDTLRLLWVASGGAWQKGLDIAIEASGRLVEVGVKFSLTIVGVTHLTSEWRSSLAFERIRLVGHVGASDMERLYRGHHALLVTSRYEACSIAVLEALRAGIPVVGSPAVAWQVGDAGQCVSSNDPSEFVRLILETRSLLLSSSYRGHALKRSAQFDWSKSLRKYEAVLVDCLAKNGVSPM